MTTSLHDLKGVVKADAKRHWRAIKKFYGNKISIEQVEYFGIKLDNSRRKMLLKQGCDKDKIESIIIGNWVLGNSTKPLE